MAMFDLEDSDAIKLDKCKTDSETLLKGRNLKNLEVSECEAMRPNVPAGNTESRAFRFLGLSFGWLMTIVGAVIASVITAWLGFSY